MADSVIGNITALESTSTTVVFLTALVLCIIIEGIIDDIATWCIENRYAEVFNKLQKLLLNLRIISFIITFVDIFQKSSEMISSSLHSFEFTHDILLFIAIAFIIQAIFLVRVSDFIILVELKLN